MKLTTLGRWLLVLAVVLAGGGSGRLARAQMPVDDQEKTAPESRFKVLEGTDLEKKIQELEKRGKDKLRDPFELFRSQVAPYDVLPFVKPRHWATLSLELRANYVDYEGRLESAPVRMQGMPHEVIFRREARLLKGQQTRLNMQVILPAVPRVLPLELVRPEAIRADWTPSAPMRQLEPHQMLIVVLAKNPNDYGHWLKFHALLPSSGDRDPIAVDRQRYYRLVIPEKPEKPALSSQPLTWTTISHVIWDSMDPDVLNLGQQQAMLDWLHWGGQVIIMGGAAPTFAALKDSFLGPYLPADPAGENALLGESELTPLADEFRPAIWPEERDLSDVNPYGSPAKTERYKEPVPIHPAPNRPIFFAGLRKRDGVGAVELPLGDRGDRLLGVERRVGRGRILMLSFTPTDPALSAWPGLDTLVRRVILRRPEEGVVSTDIPANPANTRGQALSTWLFPCLPGPELSWVRFLSRDLGAQSSPPRRVPDSGEIALPRQPVAEWSDDATIPIMCRQALKTASGITIPGSSFILKVLVAYIIALVPLNWLVSRYLIRRREWAWALVPILALGFAIGVERAAAYDLGFDSGCDEIAVLETYDDYPRAHLARFAALFSTGRVRYTISYPNDPTALALPMATGDEMRGETTSQSVWQSLPVPELTDFQGQPRSLILFHAEQMASLPGSMDLVTDQGPRRIVNGTGLELRDAVLIEDGGARRTSLGSIAPGATVELTSIHRARPAAAQERSWLDPEPFLNMLAKYNWKRPEDLGEIRLVAWSPQLPPGQRLQPDVDRHRGLTLVVAHLRMGQPPSPYGPHYDALAPKRELDATRTEASVTDQTILPALHETVLTASALNGVETGQPALRKLGAPDLIRQPAAQPANALGQETDWP